MSLPGTDLLEARLGPAAFSAISGFSEGVLVFAFDIRRGVDRCLRESLLGLCVGCSSERTLRQLDARVVFENTVHCR